MKRDVRRKVLDLLPGEAAFAEVFATARSDGKVIAWVMWRKRPYGITHGILALDITDMADLVKVGDVVYRGGNA